MHVPFRDRAAFPTQSRRASTEQSHGADRSTEWPEPNPGNLFCASARRPPALVQPTSAGCLLARPRRDAGLHLLFLFATSSYTEFLNIYTIGFFRKCPNLPRTSDCRRALHSNLIAHLPTAGMACRPRFCLNKPASTGSSDAKHHDRILFQGTCI